MKELRGRTAVVTGAASGIGLALARRFSQEGMNVVMADIEQPALAAAAATIDGDVLAVPTDVSRYEDVQALAEKTFRRFGAAHVVCNNAGVGIGGPLLDTTVEDWRWVIDVNLFGVIHGINAFLPRLVEQDEGHIVNTSSMSGLWVYPNFGVYTATKHAVVAVSETLALELASQNSRVGVTVLCPGVVKTRLVESDRNRPGATPRPPTPEAVAWNDQGIPPESVADAALAGIRENRRIVVVPPELVSLVHAQYQSVLSDIAAVQNLAASE